MRTIEITAGGETHTLEAQTIKQVVDAVKAYAEPYTTNREALWQNYGPIALRYKTPERWEEPGLLIKITE